MANGHRSSGSFEYANEGSRSYFAHVRKNRKMANFFMVMITIVVCIIVISIFFAIMFKVMAKEAVTQTGGLGDTLNSVIKNTSRFLHEAFPPNQGPGHAWPVVAGSHDGKGTAMDGSSGNTVAGSGSGASKPLHLFGEGPLSLDRVLTITGQVIREINQSQIRSQEDKRNLYHVN